MIINLRVEYKVKIDMGKYIVLVSPVISLPKAIDCSFFLLSYLFAFLVFSLARELGPFDV